MNRQGEEELDYDSSSAPSTPKNSEVNDEKKKKKRGLKKLFSMKKSADKPPSSPDRGLGKEEGLSDSRRMTLPGFLKFGGRTSKNDESKASESSESYNDNTSQTLMEKTEMHAKDSGVEASKEETKLSKLDTLTEKFGEKTTTLLERVKEDFHKHIHKPPKPSTIDDNGKPKEHQGTEFIANPGQEKEVVKHDQHHHHEKNEYFIGDVKEEKLVTIESEAITEEGRDMTSPHPPPPLQENESVGCESLAQGLQNVCLPWTVKKEEH